MSKKRWLACQVLVAAVVLVAAGVGCSSWQVGRSWGDLIYIAGAVNTTAEESPELVAGATKKALKDIDYVHETTERTATGFLIGGRNRVDQSRKIIRVYLTEGEQGGTEISIRVDSFGDKALSRKLLERIQAHLGKAGG